MEYVDKEKVIEQFNELLPWEKVDVFGGILDAIGEHGIADYLFDNSGYSPFDFTNIDGCISFYGERVLLGNMNENEIEDYLKDYPSTISARSLIEILKKRWSRYGEKGVDDSDIAALEKLLNEIKEEKNEKK